jgi:hypothetical protein
MATVSDAIENNLQKANPAEQTISTPVPPTAPGLSPTLPNVDPEREKLLNELLK